MRSGRASLHRGLARTAGVVAACLPLLDCLSQPPSAPATPPVVEVVIRGYKFEPAELTIKAGTTVKWINDEKRTSHSILIAGESGGESERLFPGESWQRTFDRPGVYAYTCGPHPEMQGRIVITP